AAGETVLANWQYLDEAHRIAAIEPLTANAPSMRLLLEAVADGRVSRLMLNTNQLRKWQSSGDKEIENRIEALWGRVRRRDDAARRQLVEQTLAQLRDGATGSVARGIAVFDRVCAQCHRLHDRGYELGPDIAGNGRGNLEQLVSNVLDPSLVIGEAFQAKTVLTVDGEIVAGLVAAESEQYLKLKVQGGQTVEFDKQDVEQIKSSSKSLMPEGVETQMTEQELWDLLAYLCLLKPLGAADNELIPGAPAGFVQP
ncbi:MAG: c-type cytochrome, partial [Planctomycetales bacterium]|nr:c-type cytochrome [Planctomycetales bacterium]